MIGGGVLTGQALVGKELMNFQVTQVLYDYIELKQSLNNIQHIKYLGKTFF